MTHKLLIPNGVINFRLFPNYSSFRVEVFASKNLGS
jgi:hypothetical protein